MRKQSRYSEPKIEVYSLFISNYPHDMNPDQVVNYVSMIASGKHYVRFNTAQKVLFGDGIGIDVDSMELFNVIMDVHGTAIGNKHLWIIKNPQPFVHLSERISSILFQNFSNGEAVFNDTITMIKDSDQISFSNPSFCEFFFFRIGVEIKDKNVCIKTLNMENNSIESIENWDRYMFFLPGLKILKLNHNLLKTEPILKSWPLITIEADPQTQNSPKRDNQW